VSSEAELRFEAEIRASAERVFALLADLRNYDRWLPRSSAFHGTTEISDGPIGVGTTYVEPGPTGIRRGRVTQCNPPTSLGFEQPMTMKPRWAGEIDIHLVHTLTPGPDSVHLQRIVYLSFAGPVRFAKPVVKRSFITENERMMTALKEYAEAPAPTPG
jgi:uncharacterized protein YndB with AHSA1/START domain